MKNQKFEVTFSSPNRVFGGVGKTEHVRTVSSKEEAEKIAQAYGWSIECIRKAK